MIERAINATNISEFRISERSDVEHPKQHRFEPQAQRWAHNHVATVLLSKRVHPPLIPGGLCNHLNVS